MAPTLEPLFRYLDGLRGRAALDDLVAAVRPLRIDCGDLADFIRFSAQEGFHGPGSPGGLL